MAEPEQHQNLKTIGILGGMGPQATWDFEARIHKVAQDTLPQYVNRGYPPLVVEYFRHAPVRLNQDGSVHLPLKPDPRLLESAAWLATRADFLVIITNTAHFFRRQIEKAAKCKVLSMIAVTLEEVRRRNLDRVGVLAVGITLENGLYQDPLEKMGLRWTTIPKELSERLDESIWAFTEGKMNRKTEQKLRKPAREATQYLRTTGVKGIILGCTEIPLILGEHAKSAYLINPAQYLASAAVAYAAGRRELPK